MATIYIITNTKGDDVFAIQPGTLNGPAGAQTNTDLRLYGEGALQWGEGVNENLYRLSESFSCPEKVGQPGIPQDQDDLQTIGAGINSPLTGQIWYNSTQEKLFVYDGTDWNSAGGTSFGNTAPGNPSSGDLWFSTDYHDPYGVIDGQLMIWNGVAWNSTASQYVPLYGATMEAGANITMTNGEVLGLPAVPSANDAAASKKYVDDEIIDVVNGAGLDGRYVNITGDQMSGDLEIHSNAPYVTLNSTNPTTPSAGIVTQHLSDSKFVMGWNGQEDAGEIATFVTGSASTRDVSMYFRSDHIDISHPVKIPLVPLADEDATSKKYVDDSISYLSSGGGSFALINPVTPKDGDIRVATAGVIEIRQGGIWRQVYPAVYS